MAKVREERSCLAAGGGGWGKGRSSKRSIKAPKSGLGALRQRLLRRVSERTTIPPASPIPTINQSLGLEVWSLISFSDWDMVIDRSKKMCEIENNLGFGRNMKNGFWKGFTFQEELRIFRFVTASIVYVINNNNNNFYPVI